MRKFNAKIKKELAVISHRAEYGATLILEVMTMFKRFAELGYNFTQPTVKMLYILWFWTYLNFCFDYTF